jgi:hypothetical protein
MGITLSEAEAIVTKWSEAHYAVDTTYGLRLHKVAAFIVNTVKADKVTAKSVGESIGLKDASRVSRILSAAKVADALAKVTDTKVSGATMGAAITAVTHVRPAELLEAIKGGAITDADTLKGFTTAKRNTRTPRNAGGKAVTVKDTDADTPNERNARTGGSVPADSVATLARSLAKRITDMTASGTVTKDTTAALAELQAAMTAHRALVAAKVAKPAPAKVAA